MVNVSTVWGRELRALYNVGVAKGLDCWGPVVNLNRDPRWGRNGEGGAEDPCEKTAFLRHLYIKMIVLPRQARDKHRENSKKDAFLQVSNGRVRRSVHQGLPVPGR
eukprot:COSAG06_NODE_4392_length_4305_cov_1.890157_5_plen_106_part_00